MADPRGWARVRQAAHGAVPPLAPLAVGVPDAFGLVLAAPLGPVPAGTTVGAFTAGFAAQEAVGEVLVHPRPRAAFLVCGDGLRAVAAVLPRLVDAHGGIGGPPVWVPDDPTALDMAVGMVDGPDAACDVLVVVGGSATLRAALSSAGAALVVDGVALSPGGEAVLATLPSGRAVVGLAGGSELAVLAGAGTLLLPVLAGLRGAPLPVAAGLTVTLDGHRDAQAVVAVQAPDGSWGPDDRPLAALAAGGRLVVVTGTGAAALLGQE